VLISFSEVCFTPGCCHIPPHLAQVLYAVGIVELELESTSALILLMFIIPLAFTLSGFLMWILYSLNGTSRIRALDIDLDNDP
jgi:hypothetical protein